MSDSSLLLPKIPIIEPEQKLEHLQALTHICIHTHIYTHLSRSAHYWTSEVKRELCSCWREWERLFFAGSGIQCSCLHFLLLWIKDWTELEQRQRWRLRRHCTPFSRPPRPASMRLTSPPSALRLFAFGISKWNDCFAIVIQRVLILLGR